MNKSLWKLGARALLPVAIIITVVYFMIHSDAGKELQHLNVEKLSDYLRSFGAFSVLLGLAVVYIQVIVPFAPFFLVAGANVLVFGLYGGFILNYTAAVLGSFSAFLFARYFGHKRVERQLSKYPAVHSFNRRMEQKGFFYVLLGRLIPVIPSTAISLGAGVTKVRRRDFLLGTVVGKFPMVMLESFIGHDLIHFHEKKERLIVLCLVFVGLLVLGSVFKNKLGKPAE